MRHDLVCMRVVAAGWGKEKRFFKSSSSYPSFHYVAKGMMGGAATTLLITTNKITHSKVKW